MKTFFPILVLATLLLFSSCDLFNLNNDPELPPITMEGKNTFGCLINGKLFLPEAPLGYGTGVEAEVQSVPDTVAVNIYAGNTSTHQSFLISFYDKPTLQVGKVYDLSDQKFFVQYIDYSNAPSCTYRKVINGNIKLLKFDVINSSKIIAGTFEFTASSIDCKDTVNVTQGRFDIGDVQ